jgi:hypothetical protein
VTHPITFAGVEKQHLVRFGYLLITPKMPHVDAAIGKHKFCRGGTLFRTLVPAPALAVDVSDSNGRRFEQKLNGNIGHALSLNPFHTSRLSWIGGGGANGDPVA